MANFTSTQKKNRNKFVIMLVGIIVILAAIVFVVYGGISAKSSLLDNQKFATAMAEMLDKRPIAVSEKDLSDIKYFEIGYDGTQYMLAIGGDDFIKAKNALKEDEVITDEMINMLKTATFEGDEEDIFTDIKYLTGVKEIIVSSVLLPEDLSLKAFTKLENATFNYNGITSTKPFTELKLGNIKELNIAGNAIEDYSALEAVSDKVIVSYSYVPVTDDEGNIVNLEMAPMTLKEYNESLAEQEAAENEENNDDTSSDDTQADAGEGETTDTENGENADETAENQEDEETAPDANTQGSVEE